MSIAHPGIIDEKLKMSFKVGKHGATEARRFNSVTPTSVASIGRGRPPAIRETEERTGVVEIDSQCRGIPSCSDIFPVGSSVRVPSKGFVLRRLGRG